MPAASLTLRGVRFAQRWAAAVVSAAFVLTAGVAVRRHRRTIDMLARAIGFDTRSPARLPAVAVDEITSAETPVVLPHVEGREGNVSVLELVVLARLARERAPVAVFEVGTFDGRTTAALASNAPAATIFTLDLPADATPAHSLLNAERQFVEKATIGIFSSRHTHGHITQLLGDSATFDFSPYVCDFVFIDGSHAFEYVINDSRKSLSILRNGKGIIIWHDYGVWDDVTDALNAISNEVEFSGLRHISGTSLAVLVRT